MITENQFLLALAVFVLIGLLVRVFTSRSDYKVKNKIYIFLAFYEAVGVFGLVFLFVPSQQAIFLGLPIAFLIGLINWKGYIHCPKCNSTNTYASVKKNKECRNCNESLHE